MAVGRDVARAASRPVIRGVAPNPNFPAPNFSNVYQAQGTASVVTGTFVGASGLDFTLTFDLYVIAHDATVRPVAGLTDSFMVPAQTGFQVVIQADNQIAVSVRDGDAAGLFASVALPISTGSWHQVQASFITDTLSLSVGATSDTLPITNRQPAGDLPFRVFGSAVASDQMQIGNIDLQFVGGSHVNYPCAEGEGLIMKDYIAQDLSSPSNGIISDESIHAIRL